jgi:hypothetical protein
VFIKPIYNQLGYDPNYYILATAFCLAIGILFAIIADRLLIIFPWLFGLDIKDCLCNIFGQSKD